jgi:putative methionine-R-sulfoxide reductase with GAF domain
VTVDRQMVARTVRDLRATLPEADDLLSGLQRVAEATRTVLEVDGAGLTLVQEDGPPRWVAATDAAMELLEHVQHDFGEGPYLQAFAQDRAISIEDLQAASAWTRIAAVVGQLHVAGVLSVPVRLASQPVGTLDVYSTQPRPWTARDLEALAEFAAVAAELVTAGVEMANRQLEAAQLRRALTNRVWIEQAKGVLAATRGTDPEVAFQQLRATARTTSRKLAEVAQEVVQDAQRQRLTALARQDSRAREAEARAQAAEHASQAAQADLAERERLVDERERAADDRDRIADARDRVADERDRAADHRD